MNTARGLNRDEIARREAALAAKDQQMGFPIDPTPKSEPQTAATVVVVEDEPEDAAVAVAPIGEPERSREERTRDARPKPKHRVGTRRNPYPRGRDKKDVMRWGVTIEQRVVLELDAMALLLGGTEFRKWAQRVLEQAIRRKLKSWENAGSLQKHPLADLFRDVLARPEPPDPDGV